MKKKLHIGLIYLLADLLIIFSIVFLCLIGCLNYDSTNYPIATMLALSFGIALFSVIIFFLLKLYKTLVDNFGIVDCIRLGVCVLFSNIAGFIVFAITKPLSFDFRDIAIWFLGVATIMFFLTFIRVIPRIQKILKFSVFNKTKKARTMIIGAGTAAKVVIDDSRCNIDNNNKIVVILDDDETKFDTLFSNIPVKGPINNAQEFIEKYKVEEVIIAIAKLSEERLHEIVSLLSKCNVRVRRMPLLSEMNGPNDIRIIDIDIDELLSRNPIKLDNHEIKTMLKGKNVLVTGAGGSIGSELVKQIFVTHPKTLVLFDIYENSTYEIQQELLRKMRNENIKDIKLVTLIGSTYNEVRVEQILKKYKIEYIYHAAAYKHVPLMEDSPSEAIRTNVIGTYNVAKLADKYKVKKMVLVSTDKAVRPTNTMGATKRFAETVIQYFSSKSTCTAYAAVRFGNVLGSNGSVVPLFKRQIEEGGPITITDKKIIRYFMTIPEAVSLILQCGLYAVGGEIFILDMGKPVKIYDLAVKLIRQAGLVPEKDIKIIETGLRPGEKLFEELLLNKETQKQTKHNRIFVEQKEDVKPIEKEIVDISKAFELDNDLEVKKLLQSIITTYTIDEGK